MFNNFANTEFYEMYQRYRGLIFKIAIGIIALIILLIGINACNKSNNQYHKMEHNLIDSAKKYEQDKGNIANQYIDAYTLINTGYLSGLANEVGFECNLASGVLIKTNGNNKEYLPYLICGDYYSETITKVISNGNTNIELAGDKVVTINTKEDYQEMGVTSGLAVETNGIVEATPGVYSIEYALFEGEIKSDSTKRLVIVSNAPTQANIPTISDNGLYLSLNGERELTIYRGSNYQELGAMAKDVKDGDITSNISVLGSVNTTKPGTYNITYSISNSRGIKVSMIRTVKVVAAPSNLTFTTSTSTTDYTNKDVKILINVSSSNYQYTLLPNNSRTYSRYISYTVANNGAYAFTLYDNNGNSQVTKVTVNNIYKGTPTGSCIADVRNGKTSISVTPYTNATYIVGYKYSVNASETTYLNSSNYTSNSAATYARVTLKDIVGSIGSFECTITGEGATVTGKAIEPDSGAKIIAQDSSSTLKVWVEEKQGMAGRNGTSSITYYQTRIWVADPVNQIKKAVTSGWGTSLEKLKTMLDKKTQTDSLINKIVVGINGSGFYKSGSWDPPSSKYDLTTEGALVITDGNVVRNWYQDAYITHYIHGVDSTGTLKVFANPSQSSTSERQQLFNTIINTGIKNTFAFKAPIVVLDGKMYESMGSFKTDSNIRQAWCQIDRNNFVILTNKYTDQRVGFNGEQQAKLFLSLGCKTAINMDGGGSTSLYFKKRGMASGDIIVNSGSRPLGDSLYFTEK